METIELLVKAFWQDKARGLLLGQACAEAVAAPFLGHVTVSNPEFAARSDDTAMMIALAEYLLTLPPAAQISEQHLAEAFADHWRREPWRGYGAGPPHVFRLAGLTETAEFRKRLDSVPELARSATPEQAADALRQGIAAEESVPTALLAFLRHSDSFVEAVRFAIQIGGDTDTIAAMTGAIAGARHGVDAIPVSWLARLENEPRIRALATRLGLRLRWFEN